MDTDGFVGDNSNDQAIRVICRFRPENTLGHVQVGKGGIMQCSLEYDGDHNVVITYNNNSATGKKENEVYSFDRVFYKPETTQQQVFDIAAAATVEDVLNGYNGTIFAYGQTGSGKTHTMFGPDISDPELRGIIPRACTQIFDRINQDTEGTEFTIKCSFLEIYKENLRDLLNPTRGTNLKLREAPGRGVWVEYLTEQYVTSEQDVLDLIKMGEKFRAVSATNMNALSSRSHSLFIMSIQQKNQDGSSKLGKLNLVDLAGSEKVSKTGATGETLEEAKQINQSLSALGNCINALVKKKSHVPYRDSKLTYLLRESLGGNCKTTLLIACSPHKFNLEETISTLKFGQRAKTIKNQVSQNKQRSVDELNSIINKLSGELNVMKGYAGVVEKEVLVYNAKFDANAFRSKVLKELAEKGGQVSMISTPSGGSNNGSMSPDNSLALAEVQVELEKLKTSSAMRIRELNEELVALNAREVESRKELNSMREKLFQSEHSLKALAAELEYKNSSLGTETKRLEFELKEANLNKENAEHLASEYNKRIEELEHELRETKEQNATKSAAIETLQRDNQKLEHKLQASHKSLQIAEQKIKTLNSKAEENKANEESKGVNLVIENTDLRYQISNLQDELKQLQELYASTNVQLNKEKQEKSLLLKENEDSTMKISKLQGSLELIISQRDKLIGVEKELNSTKSQLDVVNANVEQLNSTIQNLKIEGDKLREEITVQQTETERLRTEKESTSRRLQQEQKRLQASTTFISNLTKNVQDLNQQIEELRKIHEQELTNMDQKLKTLSKQAENHQSEKSLVEMDMISQLMEKDKEIASLNGKVETITREGEEAVRKSALRIVELEQEIAALKVKNEGLSDKVQNVTASNSDLLSKLRTSEENIAISRAELLRSNQEVAGLKIKLEDALREQLERDEQNKQILREQTSQYQSEKQESERKIKLLEEEIPKLQKLFSESQAKLLEISRERDSLKSSLATAEVSLRQVEESYTQRDASESELHSIISSQKSELIATLGQLEDLKSKISQANDETMASKLEASNLTSELERLKAEKSILESKYISVKNLQEEQIQLKLENSKKIQSLEEQLKNMEIQFSSEKKLRSNAEKQLFEISDSFLSKEQELKEIAQEVSSLKDENSALLQKQRELQLEIEQKQEKNALEMQLLTDKVDQLKERNNRLENNLNNEIESKMQIKSELDKFKAECVSLKSDIDQLKENSSKLQKEQQEKEFKLTTDIKALEQKVQELEHDNNTLYERAKLAEIELELALRNLEANQNKVKELTIEKQKMNTSLESNATTISNLENSVKTLQLEKERAIKLESDLQSLQSESAKLTAQNTQLSSSLESQKSANLQLQEDLSIQKGELEKIKVEKETLSKRLTQETERLTATNSFIANLTKEMKQAKTTSDEKIAALEAKVREYELQIDLRQSGTNEVEELSKKYLDKEKELLAKIDELNKLRRELGTVSATRSALNRELEQKTDRIKHQERQLNELMNKNATLQAELELTLKEQKELQDKFTLREEAENLAQIREQTQGNVVQPVSKKLSRRQSVVAFFHDNVINKINSTTTQPIVKKSSLGKSEKEGFLSKQATNMIKSWKKRWFMLIGDTLYYFKDKGADDVKGSVSIADILQISPVTQESSKKSYTFSLTLVSATGKYRSIILQAATQSEFDEWLKVLQAKVSKPHMPTTNSSSRSSNNSDD